MNQNERSLQWKRSWSQQEDKQNAFTTWSYDIVRKLPYKNIRTAHIFNCSDGPAALGITLALMQKSSSLDIILTDIHEYAVEAARSYVSLGLEKHPSVSIRAVIQDTTKLLIEKQHAPNHFIAFEPIAVDVELFEKAYDALLPDSSITIISRGVLGPVSQLGLAAKHKDADIFVASGMKTPSGVVTAVMLSK